MEQLENKPGFFQKIRNKINAFLHNKKLKEKLYIIIFESDTPKGKLFDVFLIGFIIASVLVVILESVVTFSDRFKLILQILEYVFTAFFTFEYLVRIYCSPKPKKYIFSFFGIVDLLATLPLYLGFFFRGARYLLIIRTFRLIRVFRVFKLFNFLEEGNLLLVSLRLSSRKIFVFFFFVLILVTSIGTIMFMVEGTQPDTQFNNIPNCIYWAIVTMTTVGYGDITPVTPVGRFISACVMLIGYTIIAVPTGIVSATMMKEHRKRSLLQCPHCFRTGHEEEAKFCKYCGGKLDDTK
ncbi:ion transporter [Parabacteroides timonensis]|uniref:ion transporter n=1 Tax=Parabacteroides timonensis TaxID=1871013 RepID=UPI00094F0969|nr:ion transporter [Parabacteroides timonensis]